MDYQSPSDAELNKTAGEHAKVCTITLVNPGLPDSVLKISPADHETEKVWLDKRPGIERWAAIEQLMQRYCPRGQYVPKPAFWHPVSGKQEDLSVPVLKPEDIPHVHLDGAVLSAPPAKEKISRPKTDEATESNRARVAQLEETVKRMEGLLEKAIGAVAKTSEVVPAPRKLGRPKKEVA